MNGFCEGNGENDEIKGLQGKLAEEVGLLFNLLWLFFIFFQQVTF